jgi:hypothetical protein
MRPRVTMRKALRNPGLLGRVMAKRSWASWKIFADSRRRREAHS